MIAVIAASIVLIGLAYYAWKQSQQRAISVEGIQFTPGNPDTDYSQMIVDPKHSKALFLFNDNTSGLGTGGNACIRGYDRALGIPTGHIETTDSHSQGGFTSIDEAHTYIPPAIHTIRTYINDHPEIEKVYYCSDETGQLGVGIFRAQLGQGQGPAILDYATKEIHSLGEFKGANGPY